MLPCYQHSRRYEPTDSLYLIYQRYIIDAPVYKTPFLCPHRYSAGGSESHFTMLFQVLLCCLLATTLASPTEEEAPVAEGQRRYGDVEEPPIMGDVDEGWMLQARQKRSKEPTEAKNNESKSNHDDMFYHLQQFLEKYHIKMTENNKVDYTVNHDTHVVHDKGQTIHIISYKKPSSETSKKGGNSSDGDGKIKTGIHEEETGGKAVKYPNGGVESITTKETTKTTTNPKSNSWGSGTGQTTETETVVTERNGSGESVNPGQSSTKTEITMSGSDKTDSKTQTPIKNEGGTTLRTGGSKDTVTGTSNGGAYPNGYNNGYNSGSVYNKGNGYDLGNGPNSGNGVGNSGNVYDNSNGHNSGQTYYLTPTTYYGNQPTGYGNYQKNFPWNPLRNHTITNYIELLFPPRDCGGYTYDFGTLKQFD